MRAFQLSLRTAIAVPFAVLFAATVALQAVTQHRQITDLIDQESVRLLDAITNTSRGRLAEFLEAPFLIQRSIGDAIARHGLYQPGNLKPLYQHLQGIFSGSTPTTSRSACSALAARRANTPAFAATPARAAASS